MCDLLDGEIICSEQLADHSVASACGCDLMSDVLAFTRPGSVLLTGLTNPQVVRTAEMLDLKAVVFVRSKRPDERTIKMAESLQLVLILSPHPLYESCGRLYTAGLGGCQDVSRAIQTNKGVIMDGSPGYRTAASLHYTFERARWRFRQGRRCLQQGQEDPAADRGGTGDCQARCGRVLRG